MPKRLEIENLENFVAVSNLQLSPSGDRLAYVVTRAQGDSYVPTLYLVDSSNGEHKRYWEKARNPVWSPDGSQLAFISTRGLTEGKREPRSVFPPSTENLDLSVGSPEVLSSLYGGEMAKRYTI